MDIYITVEMLTDSQQASATFFPNKIISTDESRNRFVILYGYPFAVWLIIRTRVHVSQNEEFCAPPTLFWPPHLSGPPLPCQWLAPSRIRHGFSLVASPSAPWYRGTPPLFPSSLKTASLFIMTWYDRAMGSAQLPIKYTHTETAYAVAWPVCPRDVADIAAAPCSAPEPRRK